MEPHSNNHELFCKDRERERGDEGADVQRKPEGVRLKAAGHILSDCAVKCSLTTFLCYACLCVFIQSPGHITAA